jgi:hypothetical protein
MYSHPDYYKNPTATSLYVMSLNNHPFDKSKETCIFPEVGDVLLIKSKINNFYKPGDCFFVHSQDENSVSDCSLVGVKGLEHFHNTCIHNQDIVDGKAAVLDKYTASILMQLHLKCIDDPNFQKIV